ERHYHQGLLDEKDKLPEEAIAEYRDAIKEFPGYVDARYRLGNLLLDKGGYGEAITQFKEALRLKPEDADVHNNLGYAYKKMGDRSAAEAEYREAVRLNPK